MVLKSFVSHVCGILATGWLALGTVMAEPAIPQAPTTTLDQLVGRWTGEGRLGFAESKFENVKCRVTYLRTETPGQLKQNIRCASASGNIEVLSELQQNGAELTGHWTETVRNMSGELTGQITPTGFRVEIKGADLNAHMDIIAKGARQLVEIQFNNSTLVGLSLMLAKG